MKRHYMLYDTATETVSYDRYLTEQERDEYNRDLREADSDARWIPYQSPEAHDFR